MPALARSPAVAVRLPSWSGAFEAGTRLAVGFGHTLNLVLLLDGIAVGGALGSVD